LNIIAYPAVEFCMRLNFFSRFVPVIFAFAGLLNFSPANAQTVFVDVEYGGDIICAIKSDNTAVCNAVSNIAGRTPADLQPVLDIASGNAVACAVLVGGDLRCWGQDAFGLLSPPDDGAPYKSIGTDNSHSCAINKELSVSIRQACAVDFNGTVSCWGLNEEGSTDVPPDLPPAQKVAAGAASSCALLLDGSIQCWGRDLPAPGAGPYIDIAIGAFGSFTSGRGGVCGTDTNGKLDCVFRSYSSAGSSPLQVDVPTSTGNSSLTMRGASSGCYITSVGEIECFGREITNLPQLEDNMPVPETTGLRADTYSDSTVELFWDAPRDAFNVAGFEIQRNGEVVALTQNGSSFIFDDIVPGETTRFAVRRVSTEGMTGPFSDSVEVVTGGVTGTGTDGYQPPVREFEPADLQALVYSSTDLELIWDRAQTSDIDGYEIRRNGEFIGFTNGTSFYDEVPTTDRVYNYDVIPVNRDDASIFYGFSSVSVGLGGVTPGECSIEE